MGSSDQALIAGLARLGRVGDCIRGGWAVNDLTGELHGLACGSRTCPDCAPSWARGVAAAWNGWHPGHQRSMLTLTFSDRWCPRTRLRERVGGYWTEFYTELRLRIPWFCDSFWVRAVELGELRERPHIHLVLDRPPGIPYEELLDACEWVWGPSKSRWEADGKSCNPDGYGFFDLEEEEGTGGGLYSYLLGDVSTWAKKGVGYMSKSRPLVHAVAVDRALYAAGFVDYGGEWERFDSPVSQQQRRVLNSMRRSGRIGDAKEVVRSCLTLDQIAWDSKSEGLGLKLYSLPRKSIAS